MLPCGIGWRIEGDKDFAKYRYLAKTKGQSISISSTYIVFVTKMQKRQTLSNGFAHRLVNI
jgi:hypothetical protein